MDPFDPATVRLAYDTVALEYDARFGRDLDQLAFDRGLLDGFCSAAGSGRPVIDVGCGPGQVAHHLGRCGLDVIGVDISTRMLDVAVRTRGIVGLTADFRRLPVRDGSCGGAVAFYSLPFVRRSELESVFAELRRVVCHGAPLLVATHLGRGEMNGPTEWLGHAVDPIAATLFGDDELARALVSARFDVCAVSHRDPLPHEHQGPRVYVQATATG